MEQIHLLTKRRRMPQDHWWKALQPWNKFTYILSETTPQAHQQENWQPWNRFTYWLRPQDHQQKNEQLLKCTGNPWTFLAGPIPKSMAGFTCEPMGFPVKTTPTSSKMVKYSVGYEENNQIDHKPLNIYPFWMIQDSFWSSQIQESIPVPRQKPAPKPMQYTTSSCETDHLLPESRKLWQDHQQENLQPYKIFTY